jgi:hypothetical protein
VSHDPRLGRGSLASPQFMSIKEGSWFGTSACIDRMMHMSSMWAAVFVNNSLTGNPESP